MTIYNATPHQINFYNKSDVEFDVAQRKYIAAVGAEPIFTIAKGTPVNCKTVNAPTPTIENCPVPVVGAVQFTSYDALPQVGYDIYIVSNLYRSAVQALGGDTSKLATVTDTVYSATDIKPCGCLALAVG